MPDELTIGTGHCSDWRFPALCYSGRLRHRSTVRTLDVTPLPRCCRVKRRATLLLRFLYGLPTQSNPAPAKIERNSPEHNSQVWAQSCLDRQNLPEPTRTVDPTTLQAAVGRNWSNDKIPWRNKLRQCVCLQGSHPRQNYKIKRSH